MSQSISSNYISESTVARMAGNIAAGLISGIRHLTASEEDAHARTAVRIARLIVAATIATESAEPDHTHGFTYKRSTDVPHRYQSLGVGACGICGLQRGGWIHSPAKS